VQRQGRSRPGWTTRPLRALGKKRWFTRLGPRVVYPMHAWLWKVTRRNPSPRDLPQLFRTTTGGRTGRPRTVPLLYLEDGNRLVVVGSNWGRARHPAWSDNLLAHPGAVVHVGRASRPVVARLVTEEERAGLWPKLLHVWPAWTTYQEGTARAFRVFLLEPARSGGSVPQVVISHVLDHTGLLLTGGGLYMARSVARPGRVDLAVEIPLPDEDGRRRLIDLYAEGLDLRLDHADVVLSQTKGVTASCPMAGTLRPSRIPVEDFAPAATVHCLEGGFARLMSNTW
jgi:deazaflavin-dependent oxidoreductase (nitroreductase family)